MQPMKGFLGRGIGSFARTVNSAFPGLKGALPKTVRRFLLLNLLGAQRGYPDVSRKVLEAELLPAIAGRHSRVLFVGTSSYTYRYERLFRPGQYTTIDSDPSQAVWGAADHIVAPVQEIGRHRQAGAFDCVVLNGVFGFGTNDPPTMRAVAQALHDVMPANGYLVLGWNDDMQEAPDKLGTFAGLFRHSGEPRRTFPGETHVYDFYVRQ
jgi:hypothetical protein